MMRSILLIGFFLSSALGFTLPSAPCTSSSTTRLNLFNDGKKPAAAVIGAALLLGNFCAAAEAIDYNNNIPASIGDSQVVLAARSGGRAGGRSSRSSYGGGRSAGRSYAAPRTTYRSSTTIVRPMIAPPPIVVSPFGGGYGYGYGGGGGLGGFGLGYGLGAMNNRGDQVRDYRQESEIQQSKAELEAAKAREAELETRIKALEEKGAPALAPAAP